MCRAILILALSALSARAGLSKLEAISMLETGNNDSAVGRAGEVSRFQIMPRTWRHFTSSQAYSDKQLSTWVADQYLGLLETTFSHRAGREPSDFDRYVLWNAGPSYYERIGFSAARVHPVIAERAQRFVNLRQMDNGPKSPAPQPMFALGLPFAPINLRQTPLLPNAASPLNAGPLGQVKALRQVN